MQLVTICYQLEKKSVTSLLAGKQAAGADSVKKR